MEQDAMFLGSVPNLSELVALLAAVPGNWMGWSVILRTMDGEDFCVLYGVLNIALGP